MVPLLGLPKGDGVGTHVETRETGGGYVIWGSVSLSFSWNAKQMWVPAPSADALRKVKESQDGETPRDQREKCKCRGKWEEGVSAPRGRGQDNSNQSTEGTPGSEGEVRALRQDHPSGGFLVRRTSVHTSKRPVCGEAAAPRGRRSGAEGATPGQVSPGHPVCCGWTQDVPRKAHVVGAAAAFRGEGVSW